jgi:diguanylate cyclase (GGDEF)-like protein
VLLPHTSDRAAVNAVCQRIVDSVAEEAVFNGATMHIGVSIGVALCPVHGYAPDPLYKAADTALYAAKHGGRGTWRWYRHVTQRREARSAGDVVGDAIDDVVEH